MKTINKKNYLRKNRIIPKSCRTLLPDQLESSILKKRKRAHLVCQIVRDIYKNDSSIHLNCLDQEFQDCHLPTSIDFRFLGQKKMRGDDTNALAHVPLHMPALKDKKCIDANIALTNTSIFARRSMTPDPHKLQYCDEYSSTPSKTIEPCWKNPDHRQTNLNVNQSSSYSCEVEQGMSSRTVHYSPYVHILASILLSITLSCVLKLSYAILLIPVLQTLVNIVNVCVAWMWDTGMASWQQCPSLWGTYERIKAGSFVYNCSYGGTLLGMLECDIRHGFNRLLVSTVEQTMEFLQSLFKLKNVPQLLTTLLGTYTFFKMAFFGICSQLLHGMVMLPVAVFQFMQSSFRNIQRLVVAVYGMALCAAATFFIS